MQLRFRKCCIFIFQADEARKWLARLPAFLYLHLGYPRIRGPPFYCLPMFQQILKGQGDKMRYSGYDFNGELQRLSNEDIIQQYRDFYQEYHRVPNAKECKEKGFVYPATFKRAAGQSPASYFRNEQAATPSVKDRSEQALNQPFVIELLSRLGTSVDDLSNRTSIPAEKIVELLTKELPKEFRQLCSIAKALEVPMDIFFPKNGNA